MTQKNVIIEIDKLTKEYKAERGEPFLAIDNISLKIQENSFTCLVGPSGCGKSTILRIAAGLEKATSGTVHYRSAPVTKPCGEIGLVFQEYSLFPWLTVMDNVAAGLDFSGVEKEKRNEEATRYLRMVNMLDFKEAYPHELSGGMRQRVAIARALANDPDVLLMDEPFGALDAHTRILLQQELLKVWELTRKTIILVTHSVDEAIFLADKILIMASRPGRIRKNLEVDIERPRSRAIPEFGKMTDYILKELEYSI
ncbi:NitT/TauT family transport system ATP-binding protein [Maridesulfovibrio ferrireducens]|uniref:NitT/TauT family transport system ATP-binding protein n=1 Tax=Maridesulfovibrio ferrireducens TaxID=246191 RepID=A0A1G9JL86_9BACT|nr:ABC transporter ATP-binding protein [Maridesulfovibrio ferrireducens]SDL37823.1 NitT/TauT family transport system ATP-binding protein [Maridesulfovibrio ferrireducens]